MPIIPMIVIPMTAVAAALLAAAPPAAAQPWPTRPMTMVVPFAAGGASDVIARVLAEGLRMELGQPVLVENVGGAGGMVGSSRIAKAAPDGYQMVLGNVGTHAQNQSLYKKPLYNAATDFAPVALVTNQSLDLVVRKDFPAANLQTFIAYAKANQANLKYGSAGVGGSNHLACALLNSAIGIDVTHIPYRSGDTPSRVVRLVFVCSPIAAPQQTAAECQEPTSAGLFGHLVGDGEWRQRHVEAKNFGWPYIDGQHVLCCELDLQVARPFLFEDPIDDVEGGALE